MLLLNHPAGVLRRHLAELVEAHDGADAVREEDEARCRGHARVAYAEALDARAEYAMFASVRQHAKERSILIITHRLASVCHADRIYVLSNGRVVEQGGHAELLALGGQYAELYTLQASQYDTAR